MSDAMDKGRELHEAVVKKLFPNAEDRIHRVGGFKSPEDALVDVIYIDIENGDGQIRAAIDAAGKPTVIVIDAKNFDNEDWLKQLLAEKKKTLDGIINMPPKEFIQEHMNVPPKRIKKPK